MHHRYRPGRIGAALGFLLFSMSAAISADLRLTPILTADEDLVKIATRADGTIAVMRVGGIDLLDAHGRSDVVARSTDPGEVLTLSDDGAFVGAVRHREGAADFTPTASFELRDAQGRVLWTLGETEDVSYAISGSDLVVGMSLNINVPDRNTLHFYADGVVVATVAVPYFETGRFDPTGAVFLAVSTRDGMRAFDRAGREMWSVPDARLFAATDEARAVAIVGQNGLRVVRDGTIAAALPLGDFLVRRVAIAPDGGRVAIAGKHEIRLFDGSLTPLWTARTESDALSWTSIDLAAGNGATMAGVARDLGPSVETERRHPDGEVRAFDARGSIVGSAKLTFPIWNIWSPTVRIDRSGDGATITTRRAIYRTVLP
jgi:hypothetical protein